MTREETSQALTVLKAAYPDFYRNITPKEAHSMLDLWSAVFVEEPLELIRYALLDLIKTHAGYPPRPADVAEKVREIIAAHTGEPSIIDYWNILLRAISNGIYGAVEEFNKLPQPLKEWLGSASALRDYARMDAKSLDPGVKGQFMKSFPAMRERVRFRESVPAPLHEEIMRLYKPMETAGELTDGQYNDRRNAVLDALQ